MLDALKLIGLWLGAAVFFGGGVVPLIGAIRKENWNLLAVAAVPWFLAIVCAVAALRVG